MWYKENHLIKQRLVDVMIKELMEKSFEEACDGASEVVRQIFKESKQVDERYGQFKKIRAQLLQHNPDLGERSEKIEHAFIITESICSDERQAEFWLFEVIDEMFKEKVFKLVRI